MINQENTTPEWENQLRGILNDLRYYEYAAYNRELGKWVKRWAAKTSNFEGLYLFTKLNYNIGWIETGILSGEHRQSPFRLRMKYEPDENQNIALKLQHTVDYFVNNRLEWTERQSEIEILQDEPIFEEGFVCTLISLRLGAFLKNMQPTAITDPEY